MKQLVFQKLHCQEVRTNIYQFHVSVRYVCFIVFLLLLCTFFVYFV